MKYALILVGVLALSSCETPGYRAAQERVIRPGEIANFEVLYAQNCSACHGPKGEGALTAGIGNPAYLAIADDSTIRETIAKGRRGTPMSAFARSEGGMLTDAQIGILVAGLRQRAGHDPAGNPPPYASTQAGDSAHGRQVFTESCARCHGAGNIDNPSYLSLVTDQHLRTVIIVGMPNFGMPDWRGYSKPLSDAEITDLVAWLAAQRQSFSAEVMH
jgi:mono/diheme cytochrome c family protein